MSEALFDRWFFENGTSTNAIVQSVFTNATNLQTMSTTLPHDDTVPTSLEGTEITELTTFFLPKRAGNKVRVTVNLFFAMAGSANVASALFKNNDISALIVSGTTILNVGYVNNINYVYEETINSTLPIIFKVRLGPASAATISLNGVAGVRRYGGTSTSSILIEEILAD